MVENSHQPDRSTLNQNGISISVDPNVTYPFFNNCMPFNIVEDIIRQKKCVVCMAEVRKKSTSIYCGLCTINSHRETDRHPSRHAYC